MGSRTHVFLDRPEQEDEQGLREALCERRSVRVRCHESPHDEALSSRLRPFHTVSLGTSLNKDIAQSLWYYSLQFSGEARYMFRKRFVRRLAVAFLLIAVLLVVVMTAAAATTDRFYVSRIIAWREADFHDFERFPSRPVPAGPEPFSFKPAPEKPPEYLRTVTYRRDVPDPRTDRESMATPLGSVGGKEVPEPLETFLVDTDTTAFLVVHDDALLYEGYFNGYDRQFTQTSFSTAKSFVSALVGIAIEEGYIESVEDPITKYIPELKGPRMDKITIRHQIGRASCRE